MSALGEFLFPAPAERTAGSIVAWWEKRRLGYNVAIIGAGCFTFVYGTVVALLPPNGGLDYPPLRFPLVVLGLANVAYLLGPVAEILIERLWGTRVGPAGPTLYRMGLTFAVGLALLPSLVITIAWVIRVLVGVVT